MRETVKKSDGFPVQRLHFEDERNEPFREMVRDEITRLMENWKF